jgi:hypothetical protein
MSEHGARTISKYPPQNHPAFVALGEEMERVKKMEGGIEFLVDLIEAIAEVEGLAIVDKAEYESLLDTAPCPYCGPGIRTGLPGNACENCMNTGLKYPERAARHKRG